MTFNLPNGTDFSPWQSGVMAIGNYGPGNIPNISGSFGVVGTN